MFRAALWKDGKAYDLNTLIDTPIVSLDVAVSLNDGGQILCGANDLDGHNIVVLLTPIQSLIGDLNLDGSVGGFDVAILLAAWGACADPCDCPMDLDDNHIVNGFDLAILLANWS